MRRILLIHTAILGFGGIPLLYMGDEIGMLNDYTYVDDPDHAADNRWAHRPRMDWDAVERAKVEPDSPAGRIRAGLLRALEVRKSLPHLHASVETTPLDSPDPRLLLLLRNHPQGHMVQVYNFSEGPVYLFGDVLRQHLGWSADEVLSGFEYSLAPPSLIVPPYQALWLVERT